MIRLHGISQKLKFKLPAKLCTFYDESNYSYLAVTVYSTNAVSSVLILLLMSGHIISEHILLITLAQ